MESNNETYGLVKNGMVATKEELTYETAVPLPFSIKDFLFDGWFDEIKENISEKCYNKDLHNFKILSPIPNPPKIICLAFNYSDHAKEQNQKPPTDPVIVMKPRTALTGTNSNIICPKFVSKVDYEIELALVIKKNCKNISQTEAQNSIFGFMILNDVSAREIQFRDTQFTRAKSFDTFAPCGPWITTFDEIPDPHNLKMTTEVNGQTRQNSSTSKMTLKIPEIISKLSQVMTLEKGDIISTGTPEGVALNNPDFNFLKNNDKIEMEIENLGKIENTVKFLD